MYHYVKIFCNSKHLQENEINRTNNKIESNN